MPRKSRDVIAALRRKGFTASEGDHVFLTYVTTEGLRTKIYTKVSHGGSHDLGDYLIGQMARQLKLSKAMFLSLVDCPLQREDYENELRNKGAFD